MFEYEVIQNLNELELSLYEYIMKNSEKVMYMKIRDLANEAHVSTTTILRFCKKVNCVGFSEFKLKFKMYMEGNCNKKVNEDVSVILDNFERMADPGFDGKVNELCELINNAENLIFIGGGLSGIVAKYGARYMASMGKFAVYIDDLLFPVNCEYYKNNLVIVLSVSGETPEIINAINIFKKQKCRIASITNSANSTIARMSNFNISYYIPEEKVGLMDVTSHLPPIYIIETVGKRLYNNCIVKQKYKVINNIDE